SSSLLDQSEMLQLDTTANSPRSLDSDHPLVEAAMTAKEHPRGAETDPAGGIGDRSDLVVVADQHPRAHQVPCDQEVLDLPRLPRLSLRDSLIRKGEAAQRAAFIHGLPGGVQAAHLHQALVLVLDVEDEVPQGRQ